MKLRIVSKGPFQTYVENAETGERLMGVVAVRISCDARIGAAHRGRPVAEIVVLQDDLDVIADVTEPEVVAR